MSSSIGQAQGSSSSIEARVILPFLSILGFLIEVKSQGYNISLFEKHKAIIYSFVVAISIYMGTIFVGKKLGLEAIRPIQLLSGIIAPILLLLILVPNFGWLLLVLWVFLAAKMAWDYLPQLYHYLFSQEGGRVSNLFAILTLNSTSIEGSQDDIV